MMYEPVKDEFTIVHAAARTQRYDIMFCFIQELGFDVDYYKEPLNIMTLLHVIAKYHHIDFTDKEKVIIKKLIGMSNNLLLRNNFGKKII
jgi:hypothetical protein